MEPSPPAPDFRRVASLADIPPGEAIKVLVEARHIALFNVGGTLYAIKDLCPHLGVELHRGSVEGTIVTCAGHGWQFDLRTGICERQVAIRTRVYPVKVEGGDVFVGV
ncbi:MAG: Rieske (2Fe-2S) protein [Planctomycetales bacterium]|nr:Rieske (2Fe-2S) protein [Planctomycetales bacterium]